MRPVASLSASGACSTSGRPFTPVSAVAELPRSTTTFRGQQVVVRKTQSKRSVEVRIRLDSKGQRSKQAVLWPWRNRWRYLRSMRANLPRVDWTRYNLQVLFVDRTDTVRARVAAGLFQRVAEWNGYGRALYPTTCGVVANQAIDISTTVSLMNQAALLGISPRTFARKAEQFEYADFDRFDLIVALDRSVLEDVMVFAGPTSHDKEWYAPRVCLLSDFAKYASPHLLLARGGSALLEPELSRILAPVMQSVREVTDIERPTLLSGAKEWNHMVETALVSCAGLVQYLADAIPPDLAHWDPQ